MKSVIVAFSKDISLFSRFLADALPSNEPHGDGDGFGVQSWRVQSDAQSSEVLPYVWKLPSKQVVRVAYLIK